MEDMEEIQQMVDRVWGHLLKLVDALEELELKLGCKTSSGS